MAYDPQAGRRRPKPDEAIPAPVDAILGNAPAGSGTTPPAPVDTRVADDPPPSVSVTPEPADPPPDELLISTGVAAAIGGLIGLLTLRHLWRRHRRQQNEAAVDAD